MCLKLNGGMFYEWTIIIKKLLKLFFEFGICYVGLVSVITPSSNYFHQNLNFYISIYIYVSIALAVRTAFECITYYKYQKMYKKEYNYINLKKNQKFGNTYNIHHPILLKTAQLKTKII